MWMLVNFRPVTLVDFTSMKMISLNTSRRQALYIYINVTGLKSTNVMWMIRTCILYKYTCSTYPHN